MDFKNKKVLIMGLGSLGGGVSSAKWFVKRGASVSVTDLRTGRDLKKSIKNLGASAKKIKFILGRHDEEDFKNNDIIVVNPAVPRESVFISLARKNGKEITNDAKIFFNESENKIIAVTGTRGKTTTTNWISHFIRSKHKNVRASGNTPENPLLSLIGKIKKNEPAVLELSSWQLELVNSAKRGPEIALITNIFPDHLNRYSDIKSYALAKANIFSKQTENQKLILNYDNKWTRFFIDLKPKSEIYLISLNKPPKNKNGLFVHKSEIIFSKKGKQSRVFSKEIFEYIKSLGEHNVYNFLFSALTANLYGISWKSIEEKSKKLPQIFLRQEIILKNKNITVVNDSAGTSPDATEAAIKRFSKKGELILITGGTDKKLEFKELAKVIKSNVNAENLFLLDGSATKKLISKLKKIRFFDKSKLTLFDSLYEILKSAKKKIRKQDKKYIIVFSPGSASFEKFKNEFDRGEKFALYSKKIFK